MQKSMKIVNPRHGDGGDGLAGSQLTSEIIPHSRIQNTHRPPRFEHGVRVVGTHVQRKNSGSMPWGSIDAPENALDRRARRD